MTHGAATPSCCVTRAGIPVHVVYGVPDLPALPGRPRCR